MPTVPRRSRKFGGMKEVFLLFLFLFLFSLSLSLFFYTLFVGAVFFFFLSFFFYLPFIGAALEALDFFA